MTPAALVATGALAALAAGLYLLARHLDRPRTDSDRYHTALDDAFERWERQRALRERDRTVADEHWAGVEASWHAFLDGFPTLDEAGR